MKICHCILGQENPIACINCGNNMYHSSGKYYQYDGIPNHDNITIEEFDEEACLKSLKQKPENDLFGKIMKGEI